MNKSLVIMLVAVLGLSGCGNVRDTLGLSKNRPNEFNVLTNPPLVLPPDFNLRPPGSGARPAALQGRDLARALVLPAPPASEVVDGSEQALLDKASDGIAYGDGIREQLENDRRGTVSRPAREVDGLVQGGTVEVAADEKDPDAGCRFLICF